MERNKLLSADYLDIIFDGRNKLYGGYELRRKYAARTRRATMIVVVSAALAASIPVIAANLSSEERTAIRPVEVVNVLRELPVTKPKEQPPVIIPEPPAPIATIANPVLQVVADKNVTEPPVTVDELQGKAIGLTDNPGLEGEHALALGEPSGKSRDVFDEGVVAAPKIHIAVEQMPQFNGDLAQYLNDHLQYPEEARAAGIDGRVGIKFVVNEDGSISDVEVMHKANPLLDAEAMRVVRSMPRWKPGKQGGKAVKVYFTLPVTFQLD